MKKSKNTLNNESTVNTVKGYSFFNTENKVYVDEYFSSCESNELPYVYNDIEDAQEAIENENVDIEDFEIHKIEKSHKHRSHGHAFRRRTVTVYLEKKE